MKKIISLTLTLVLLFCATGCGTTEETAAPTPEPFNISVPENLTFGMKESEIIGLYGEPWDELFDTVTYRLDNLYGYKSHGYDLDFDNYEMKLTITEKGLQTIEYAFIYSYKRGNSPYLSGIESVKSKVIEKYGEPLASFERWNNEKYKEDPASWDKAIDKGHLEIIHSWETEQSTITLTADMVDISLKYTAK